MNRLKRFYNNSRLLNFIRYRITPYMIKKKAGALLFDNSNFYRLNLNCRGDAFYGYVNIEERRTKGRVFVSSMSRLPFKDNSVKYIIVDFETLPKEDSILKKIFKEWSRIMVPNAVLTLDNIYPGERLINLMKDAGLELIVDDYKRNLLPVLHFLNNPFDDYSQRGTDFRETNYLEDILEYMSPSRCFEYLKWLYERIPPGEKIEILVRNETIEDEHGRRLSFFDKANLCFFLTEIGFRIGHVEIVDKKIKASVSKPARATNGIIRKKRICFIEQFLMFRYTHLGFDDDAMPRACGDLGMDYLLVEGMRNIDKEALRKAILSFRPDYLLFRLKEILPFVMYIRDDLKKIGTKVIFWFCDPEHPDTKDLSRVIDIMFLSNRGQIEEYKKSFNLDRIFYMPQGFDPYAIHRISAKEIYDVAFAGALSSDYLHDTRRKLMEKLKTRYNVIIKNNIRNNISEFYSQSKTVFGASDFDYELYTSNRFFVALGCGACYITKKFKGIELLVEKHKHALWFEDEKELFELLDYYLTHDKEREMIRQNAERLAFEKHTYTNRLRNIMDIIEGKTDKFYGFL